MTIELQPALEETMEVELAIEQKKQQQQQRQQQYLQRLQDDIISLTRVRNRLASSKDSNLPTIVAKLVPKLLERLNGYYDPNNSHAEISNGENDGEGSLTYQLKKLRINAKGIIWGILDHALERLKGHPDLENPEQIMFALLPFIDSSTNNVVTCTWVLTFQQLFIQRISSFNPNSSDNNIVPILSSLMAALIRCIDRIKQQELTVIPGTEDDIHDKNQRRLFTNASWLLLDCIMLLEGYKPMIDWGKDEFDPKDKIRTLNTGDDSTSYLVEVLSAVNEEGVGVFHWMLDLMLFWPTLNATACGISARSDALLRERSKASTSPATTQRNRRFGGAGNNNEMAAAARRRQIAMGMQAGGSDQWSDMDLLYLRYLKSCALKFAISIFDNNRRALILGVLLTSHDSMHGRLATDYLKAWSNNKNTPISKVPKHHQPQHSKQSNESPKNNNNAQVLSSIQSSRQRSCPVSIVISLLILSVGERRALPVLKTYDQIESINRSENSSLNPRLWEQVLGKLPSMTIEMKTSTERPKLPLVITARAIEFLLQHPLGLYDQHQEVGTSAKLIARLIIDLILLLSHRDIQIPVEGENDNAVMRRRLRNQNEEQEIKQGKYWAILLVKHFYSQFIEESSRLDDADDIEWAQDVSNKCLDACEEVLSVVVELGESKLRQQQVRPNGQLPLGVPLPFNNRNDLNLLLNTHRETLQRKQLQLDEALEARQIAYEFIATLRENVLRRETKPFQLSIFLFKCIVHENPYLHQYVSTALKELLEAYTTEFNSRDCTCGEDTIMEAQSSKDTMNKGTFRCEQAVPMLGCLLDVILSDSDVARYIAAQYIQTLLILMDAEAACHLASYLVHDTDTKVAECAKSVLALRSSINTANKQRKDDDFPMIKVEFFDFVDIKSDHGRQIVQREVKFRAQAVSTELGISMESAATLLFDFHFSVDKVNAAFHKTPGDSSSMIMENSGLPLLSAGVSDMSCEDDSDETKSHYTKKQEHSFCGICYEELSEVDTKSLDCGHIFCGECWISFLETASREGSMSFLNTRCPQHKCNARLRSDHFKTVVPTNELLFMNRWDEAYIDAFIELDPAYRYCPGPDCEFVATVPLDGQRCQSITCERCETSFCFKCGDKPHHPATCGDYAEFGKLMGSSTFWVKKNAKPCPGCQAPIEKNDGCNHMTCGKCHQQFCWVCLAKLNRHSEDHACNQYDPAENADDDYERHALFVSDRYQAHDTSEYFATQNLKKFKDRPRKLVEMFWFLTSDDEQTLRNGFDTVIQARRVLKNSYVASFGLRREPQKMKSLESYQGALEVSVLFVSKHFPMFWVSSFKMVRFTNYSMFTIRCSRNV